MSARIRYAYLHGFGSGASSKKATALSRVFAAKGVALELPDLNRPTFETLSPAAQLAAIDALCLDAAGSKWRFVGSSMGGFLAARWAELHPARVDRALLLCPGFDMASRWPAIVGAKAFERWRTTGTHPFPDPEGKLHPVHFAFWEEGKRQPPFPAIACPAVIVHGTRDATVPIESSRRYAQEHPNVRLIEVDDGHDLLASLDLIATETMRFFGFEQRPDDDEERTPRT